LQARANEISAAADRTAAIAADPEHHLALRGGAVLASLDPERWADARQELQDALATYGSDPPTWQSAQTALSLFWLGGSDESAVVPIADHLDSPVFSAMFAFFRGVPYYMVDDDATAAELAGEAVTLARAAGALVQLGTALLGDGGWRARVADATADDVFGPLAESLDLWDRLRIPWGLVAVAEESAQALAIRGYYEEAFVLWGAVDNSEILTANKVGRHRRADPYITQVPADQATAWRARGAELTADETFAFARRTFAGILNR
jgi:hypothetical protein